MAELGTGHAHDDHAIDDQRCAGHRVAVLGDRGLGRIRHPDLFAGLGVQRNEPVVHERTNDHAFVDRGAAIDDAAADNAQALRRIVVNDPPNLLAGQGIDRHRRVVGGGVDDAIPDEGKTFAALEVGERIGPYRDQSAHILLVDLGERAEPVCRISHAVDEHVAGRFFVVLQIIGRLGKRRKRHGRTEQDGKKHRSHYAHYDSPPRVVFLTNCYSIFVVDFCRWHQCRI